MVNYKMTVIEDTSFKSALKELVLWHIHGIWQLSVVALLVFFCPKSKNSDQVRSVSMNLNNQAAVKIKSSNPYFCDLSLALIQVLNLNLLCLPTCDDSYQLNN